jgi:hypothetical protein
LKLYRLLTGPDDASFCHKISDALNKGWLLYGSPTLTFDSDDKAYCGQAVFKEVEGTYLPDLKLSEG